jgi:predicted DNA-binding WGR domain protein
VEYRRLYRQGRIVVVHTGKTGKDGRIAVKLHPDASKANKDATKKVAKFHQDLGLDLP